MSGEERTPRVFESRFRARSYELDGFGHVNHAVFFNWFEQARFDCLARGGFDPTRMEEREWVVAVVHAEADFEKEVRLGDAVVVRTRVTEVRTTSMVLSHEVVRTADDVRVARGSVVAVWLGPDRRPMRIPEIVLDALQEPASAP